MVVFSEGTDGTTSLSLSSPKHVGTPHRLCVQGCFVFPRQNSLESLITPIEGSEGHLPHPRHTLIQREGESRQARVVGGQERGGELGLGEGQASKRPRARSRLKPLRNKPHTLTQDKTLGSWMGGVVEHLLRACFPLGMGVSTDMSTSS